MLSIIFGHPENERLSGNGYFDVNVDESIIETDLAKEIIKGVDKGTVIGRNNIDTEILGAIPPRLLSGGTKTLLTLLSDDSDKVLFNMSAMGDNCLPYLAMRAKMKDITLSTDQYRKLFQLTDIDCVYIKNNDIYVDNDDDFWNIYLKYAVERNSRHDR